jgi:hypothetical protein
MWVVKTKGKTYYVDHVEADIPWSTKETPDNEHTKGSIKFKNCLCTIDEDNCATLSVLTEEDKIRLGAVPRKPSVIWFEGYTPSIEKILDDKEIKHQGVLTVSGECTTAKQMAGVYNESDLSMLVLMIPGLRVLNENESYYKHYLKWLENNKDELYEDDDHYWDEEEEEPVGILNIFKQLRKSL